MPEIGARIALSGRDGEFLLVHIDHSTLSVAVVSLTGRRVLEERIPFAHLRTIQTEACAVEAEL